MTSVARRVVYAMVAALPDGVAALLAEAFTAEVVERLPELQAGLVAGRELGDVDAVRLALRHAHTLASSAVVVGEGEIALVSRRCEEHLVRSLASADLDADELAAAAEDVAAMTVLLDPWLTRGVV